MACSLEGKVFGKLLETASLTAVSMMEVAAVSWVLQGDEVGIRAVGEWVVFQLRTNRMGREERHSLTISLQQNPHWAHTIALSNHFPGQ